MAGGHFPAIFLKDGDQIEIDGIMRGHAAPGAAPGPSRLPHCGAASCRTVARPRAIAAVRAGRVSRTPAQWHSEVQLEAISWGRVPVRVTRLGLT